MNLAGLSIFVGLAFLAWEAGPIVMIFLAVIMALLAGVKVWK